MLPDYDYSTGNLPNHTYWKQTARKQIRTDGLTALRIAVDCRPMIDNDMEINNILNSKDSVMSIQLICHNIIFELFSFKGFS